MKSRTLKDEKFNEVTEITEKDKSLYGKSIKGIIKICNKEKFRIYLIQVEDPKESLS